MAVFIVSVFDVENTHFSLNIVIQFWSSWNKRRIQVSFSGSMQTSGGELSHGSYQRIVVALGEIENFVARVIFYS